jgi:hypothetical protein
MGRDERGAVFGSQVSGVVDGVAFTAVRWIRVAEPGQPPIWGVSVKGKDIGYVPDGLTAAALEELVRVLMRQHGFLPAG